LSGLLLLYHLCNFNETLQDWSVDQVLAHIARVFRLNDFWPSYGPLIKRCFLSVCCQIRKSLSGLLLINYWCNFIQTLQEWSVPSQVVHCSSVCPSVTKFVPTWNWPSWGDTCDYWSLLFLKVSIFYRQLNLSIFFYEIVVFTVVARLLCICYW
jgi:hypothetical protein